jgi:Domain of unknown function (DUF4760)
MDNHAAPFISNLAYYGVTPESFAIIFSTLVAAIFAWLTIQHGQKIAKSRLTFETIQRTLWDKDYLESRKVFIRLRDENDGLVKYAGSDSEYSDQRAHIRGILNNYENVCIGMKMNIIDEQQMYFWERSTLTEDWEKSKAYITHIRQQLRKPKLFETFEEFAENWKNGSSASKKGKKLKESQKIVLFNNTTH